VNQDNDPSVVNIEASDVKAATNDGSILLVANVVHPGVLRVAVASSQPIPSGEVFATLNFTATSLQGMTPIAIGMASVDEERIHTETVSGRLSPLSPIEKEGEVVLSENIDGRLYADNTQMTLNNAPMGPSLNRWALYGVDRVNGENVAFLKDHEGTLLKARATQEWKFRDFFHALSNMNKTTLSRNARGIAFAIFYDSMLETQGAGEDDGDKKLFAPDPGLVQHD